MLLASRIKEDILQKVGDLLSEIFEMPPYSCREDYIQKTLFLFALAITTPNIVHRY
jgi:hypothetical protein